MLISLHKPGFTHCQSESNVRCITRELSYSVGFVCSSTQKFDKLIDVTFHTTPYMQNSFRNSTLHHSKLSHQFLFFLAEEELQSPMIESDTTESSPQEVSVSLSSSSSDQPASGSMSVTESAALSASQQQQQQSKSLFSVITSAASGKRRSKKKNKNDKAKQSNGESIGSKLRKGGPLKLFRDSKEGKTKQKVTDAVDQDSDAVTNETDSSQDSLMTSSISSDMKHSISVDSLDPKDHSVINTKCNSDSITSVDSQSTETNNQGSQSAHPPSEADQSADRRRTAETVEEEEPFDIFAPTPPGRRKLSWAEQVEMEEAENGGHLGFEDNFADNEFILCDGQIFSMSSFDSDFASGGQQELFPDDDFNRLYDDILQSVNDSSGDLSAAHLPPIPEETQSCDSHDAIITASHCRDPAECHHIQPSSHLTLEFTHQQDYDTCNHSAMENHNFVEINDKHSQLSRENQYAEQGSAANTPSTGILSDMNAVVPVGEEDHQHTNNNSAISRSDNNWRVQSADKYQTDSASKTLDGALNNLNKPSVGSQSDIRHNIHHNKLTLHNLSFDNNNDINISVDSCSTLGNDDAFSSLNHENTIRSGTILMEDVNVKSSSAVAPQQTVTSPSEGNNHNSTVTVLPAADQVVCDTKSSNKLNSAAVADKTETMERGEHVVLNTAEEDFSESAEREVSKPNGKLLCKTYLVS